MKQLELANWLKLIVIVAGVIGLLFCFLIAPMFGRDTVSVNPELDYMFFPSLVFIWITAIPFYIALWKIWLISGEISNDNSFCEQNAIRLKLISKLALSECVLYSMAILVLLFLSMLHPGILIIALLIIFIGISIAVAAAAISHLVEKASDLKDENDLTI